MSQNGYTYVKTEKGWKLKHHIIAEEKYGRSIKSATERVVFLDRDRTNFDPDNIEIVNKKSGTKAVREAMILDQMAELQEELEALKAEEDAV